MTKRIVESSCVSCVLPLVCCAFLAAPVLAQSQGPGPTPQEIIDNWAEGYDAEDVSEDAGDDVSEDVGEIAGEPAETEELVVSDDLAGSEDAAGDVVGQETPAEVDEPAALAEAIEADEPVEEVALTEAVEPAEVVEPIEAEEPVQQVALTEAVEPAEAVEPIEAEEPAEIADALAAEDTAETETPVLGTSSYGDSAARFPYIGRAIDKDGVTATANTIAKVIPGMKKKEIYPLLGIPSFHAGFEVRQWNYLVKMEDLDGTDSDLCQLQIKFRRGGFVENKVWRTKQCADHYAALLAS